MIARVQVSIILHLKGIHQIWIGYSVFQVFEVLLFLLEFRHQFSFLIICGLGLFFARLVVDVIFVVKVLLFVYTVRVEAQCGLILLMCLLINFQSRLLLLNILSLIYISVLSLCNMSISYALCPILPILGHHIDLRFGFTMSIHQRFLHHFKSHIILLQVWQLFQIGFKLLQKLRVHLNILAHSKINYGPCMRISNLKLFRHLFFLLKLMVVQGFVSQLFVYFLFFFFGQFVDLHKVKYKFFLVIIIICLNFLKTLLSTDF